MNHVFLGQRVKINAPGHELDGQEGVVAAIHPDPVEYPIDVAFMGQGVHCFEQAELQLVGVKV